MDPRREHPVAERSDRPSSAGLPTREVAPLLVRELVDANAETGKLQPRNFFVDGLGDVVNPRVKVNRVSRDVDDGGRLLWIPEEHTRAGIRPLQVPIVLQPTSQR